MTDVSEIEEGIVNVVDHVAIHETILEEEEGPAIDIAKDLGHKSVVFVNVLLYDLTLSDDVVTQFCIFVACK